MTLGFFTVFRADPQHYLHATSLVREAHRVMPGVSVVQFTDVRSPAVTGIDAIRRGQPGPMLQRRLEHYAGCKGTDWLLVDTDVSIRADVRAVFDDPRFDVALTDRAWPHIPQGDQVMHTMPFNTGVVFSRAPDFWRDVLAVWLAMPEPRDWLSEQRAVYQVVRSGAFRVKILPGLIYNYPLHVHDDPAEDHAALVHYKGPRKAWLTTKVYAALAAPERQAG